ncbi:MAG: HAD-IA family hydrolase, partial [Candidatus Lokiarchaeota archaeon]
LYHSCEEREWFPFADTQKTLETLKQKGLKIGLISNHPYHISILNMLETYNLKNYFDAIMTSARFGKRKPHVEIFLKTISKMGLSEEANHQTIMCGDEYADIIGASKAGLIPVFYHRKVEFPYEKEINLSNIKTIEGIYDIVGIIENFNI